MNLFVCIWNSNCTKTFKNNTHDCKDCKIISNEYLFRMSRTFQISLIRFFFVWKSNKTKIDGILCFMN